MSRHFRRVFSEKAMIVLSVASIPPLLLQLAATPSPQQSSVIDAFDLGVVAIFAIDYAFGLSAAPIRAAFARAPPNLLALSIIALALCGLLFSLPLLLSAPVLRLVRIFRAYGEAGHVSVEAGTSIH